MYLYEIFEIEEELKEAKKAIEILGGECAKKIDEITYQY